MNYVLIEEDAGYVVRVSGPGTMEQLRALLPDGLMKCETNDEVRECWATESCDKNYAIVPLTPI